MKKELSFQETLRKRVNAFWPVFLAAHLDRVNQKLHVFGTAFMFTSFALFALTGHGLFFGLAFCGYVPSWIGHFFFEKNRPPTLQSPIIAGICELKMAGYFVAGELNAEVERLFGIAGAKPGTPCKVSSEDEEKYQETLRYRIREDIPSHPFEEYWKIFLMKHQNPVCVYLHAFAMVYFYSLCIMILFYGHFEWIVAIPVTQLIGLFSHALFERNHIDFEDAIFSPRAFGCLNRMLYLLLTGKYFEEAKKVVSELTIFQTDQLKES